VNSAGAARLMRSVTGASLSAKRRGGLIPDPVEIHHPSRCAYRQRWSTPGWSDYPADDALADKSKLYPQGIDVLIERAVIRFQLDKRWELTGVMNLA
jgi:hypothetical protein